MIALARRREVLLRVVGGHAWPRRQFQAVLDCGDSTNRLSEDARNQPGAAKPPLAH